ncbi:unnamed protein product, partial [Ilex paraguariensis]
ANVDRSAGKRTNLRLDDWVLCRLYNKKGINEKHYNLDQNTSTLSETQEQKPKIISFAHNGITLPPPLPTSSMPPQMMDPYLNFDTTESKPRLHMDSSGSEHVASPEFACEVQSEPKWNELEKALDFQLDYMGGFGDDPLASRMQYSDQLWPMQDMFLNLQEPF